MPNTKLYEEFAQVCATITEASSTINLIANHPGGKELIRHLHKTQSLSHDQQYSPVDKISWSGLKDTYKGSWVIVIGSTGTGAIKASGGTTGNYDAVAVDKTTGEIRSLRDSRGGNVMDFFKPLIGKPTKFYVGRESGTVKDKKKQRAERNAIAGPGVVNQETLVKKFKPLWIKAITASIADIKGHISNQVKNDAFDKAKKKISQIESLQNALDMIESGSTEIPGSIRSAVNTGVLMAAAHFYPTETGNITRGYSSGYSAERSEGPAKLLKDIGSGDQSKLGTVLAFFKRALISG